MTTRYIRLKTHTNDQDKIKFRRIATALVLAVCLVGLGLWIFRTLQNINNPQMEYSEGFIVYLAQLFNGGQFEYSFAGPPYMTSFYTPLFYYLLGFLGSSLFMGRLIVVCCVIISMCLVYLIVSHITRNKVISLIAALLPMTQYIMIQWSVIIRVDMLALTFELAGIYLALRFWKSRLLYLSIPLFLLAFWTKQSYFLGPVVIVIALLLQGYRSRCLIYALVTGGFVIVSLGIAAYLTDGEFIKQIFMYQKTSPMFMNITYFVAWQSYSYWPLLPVMIFGIFYVCKHPKDLISIFAVLAVALNAVLMMRMGAAQNYQFEVIFAICIIGGLGIIDIIQQKQKIYIGLFIAITVITLFAPGLVSFPDPGYKDDVKKAVALISDADYPILTENASIVLEAGKVPYLTDPFMFMNFTTLGFWDEGHLIDDLRTNKIPYVVTQYKLPATLVRRFNAKVQQTIMDNYHIVMDASDARYGFVVYKANNYKGGGE